MKARAAAKLRVACVQNSAGSYPQKNLKNVLSLCDEALSRKPHAVALPENFYWRGPKEEIGKAAQWTQQVLEIFKQLARKSRCAFILGSVIERSRDSRRFYNTLVYIDKQGRQRAAYRKIHLFDVQLPQGVQIRESETTLAGNRVISAKLEGQLAGFAICYDLRFPELFRALVKQGSRVIFLPANFTRTTGRAHWEILLRARAIENQIFLVAPAQTGRHPVTGVASFGNSLIIDPWGNVLAKASLTREQVIWADLDWQRQAHLRASFPVLRHQRLS